MITSDDISVIKTRCGLNNDAVEELLNLFNNPEIKINQETFVKYTEQFYIYHGENYNPNITRQPLSCGTLYAIEPPCGSTTYVIETPQVIIVIDSGFTCYADELKATLENLIPNFDAREKILILTHSDLDHVGLLECFSRIYLSRIAYEDLQKRAQNKITLREISEKKRPYYRAVSILAKSSVVNLENMHPVSDIGENPKELLTYTGNLSIGTLNFEVYETSGGHIVGSLILIERTHRLVFAGDTFVNPDMRKEQISFITLSSSSILSLNADSVKAKFERASLFKILGSENWIVCGGHGGPFNYLAHK